MFYDKIKIGDQIMNIDRKREKKKNKKKISKKKKISLFLITLIMVILCIAIYYLLMPKEKEYKKLATKKDEVVEKLKIVDENSNQRPIAVMIDNNVGNSSHAGLQDSYINYEIIVEGGLTRIMAVFKDKNVSLIGPVRSSRHYFLDYALESDCIYTHYGWSTYAENDIKALSVNNINGLYDEQPFWRDNTIAAPHNVFTTTERIYSYASTKQYPTTTSEWQLLNYSTSEVDLSTPIGTKTVTNEETGKK